MKFAHTQSFSLSRMLKHTVIWLFLDECEDLLEFAHFISPPKRRKTNDIFKHRRTEGSFSILIERYLFSDHDKFISYLRVSPRVFYIILKYVRQDIYVAPYNRVKNLIDPSQKLCIALRY